MTDFLLPPDLAIAKSTPSLAANTAAFSSPTVGSTRTVERLGDAYRFSIDMTTVRDDAATGYQRGRLQAILSRLRGQANRLYLTPPGAKIRGAFPTSELFSNGTFGNGTTGITGGSTGAAPTLSVADRVLRVKSTDGTSANWFVSQTIVGVSNAPYVARAFFLGGSVSSALLQARLDNAAGANLGNLVQSGLSSLARVHDSANIIVYAWYSTTGLIAGALIDNAPNLALNSDSPGNGTGWSLNAATAAAFGTAPDGVNGSWGLTETTATSAHYFSQSYTVVSTANTDYSASFLIRAGLRSWAWVQISEATGGTTILAFINLGTGAIGSTPSTGTNWANLRMTVQSYGNGWYRLTLTARKTNAATSLIAYVGAATADNTPSYAGSTSSTALQLWRHTFNQSSFPVRPDTVTTSAASVGTSQSSTTQYIKGLPASTSGLLLEGDWIECNGQLNQIVGSLDSDAQGCGYAQLARPFRNAPADGAPFIVNNPMGKFMLASNSQSWVDTPGVFTDASIDLVEDISF
jgi:hypothetical protein